MKQEFKKNTLSNGITLLCEEIKEVSSAAFSIFLPFGSAIDPVGEEGAAGILMEMLNKGAGPWDARQLSDQFESIGIQHGQSTGIEVSAISAAGLAENIAEALRISAVMLMNPLLPEGELENVRQLALQDLNSLEDAPSQKVMVELTRNFYPYPFSRPQIGTIEGIKSVNIDSLRNFHQRGFVPERAVIGVAGNISWPEIKSVVEKSFGAWSGVSQKVVGQARAQEDRIVHLEKDTNQLQIALGYNSVSVDHKDFYVARVAVNVLSGGMSGRLFIEVREKRGLVYSVSASHNASKGRGAVFAYAGTTPERSEETLEVMLRELRNLKNGVTDEELVRAKNDLKSKVLMQSESSSVRASSLTSDWWNLGRIRTIDEIKAAIDSVTAADIQRHLEQFPVSPITMVTLGSRKLELPQ